MRHLPLSLCSVMLAGIGLGPLQAQAADLASLPPPPPPYVVDIPLRGPVILDTGPYIRADIGAGFNRLDDSKSSVATDTYGHESRSPGPIIGIGAGYKFNPWLRTDLTAEWHGGGKAQWSDTYACTVNGGSSTCSDQYSARINHGIFLLNGYADLGKWSGLTPYIGVGLGTAYTNIGTVTELTVHTGGTQTAPSVSKWQFAWALIAGVSHDLSPRLKLDVNYRYLNLGSLKAGTFSSCNCEETPKLKLSSHDFRVGLRYVFADLTAPPPPPPPVVYAPPPIVRKY